MQCCGSYAPSLHLTEWSQQFPHGRAVHAPERHRDSRSKGQHAGQPHMGPDVPRETDVPLDFAQGWAHWIPGTTVWPLSKLPSCYTQLAFEVLCLSDKGGLCLASASRQGQSVTAALLSMPSATCTLKAQVTLLGRVYQSLIVKGIRREKHTHRVRNWNLGSLSSLDFSTRNRDNSYLISIL